MREKQNIITICGATIQKVKNGQKFMVLVKNHPQDDAILLSVLAHRYISTNPVQTLMMILGFYIGRNIANHR